MTLSSSPAWVKTCCISSKNCGSSDGATMDTALRNLGTSSPAGVVGDLDVLRSRVGPVMWAGRSAVSVRWAASWTRCLRYVCRTVRRSRHPASGHPRNSGPVPESRSLLEARGATSAATAAGIRLFPGGQAGQFSCTHVPLRRLRASCRGAIGCPQRPHRSPTARAALPSNPAGEVSSRPSPIGRELVTGKPMPPGQKCSRCAARTRSPICIRSSARRVGPPPLPSASSRGR
jgi:hypothetical protein